MTDPDSKLDDRLEQGILAAFRQRSECANALPPAADQNIEVAPPPASVGRFRVTGVLGRGGMGIVLRATDPELDREVAVKIFDERRCPHSELAALFDSEARLSSQLQHPGIVPVYEVGRTEGGRPYMVMRIVEGQTLCERLSDREESRVELHALLTILASVCETVSYAHQNELVHRDLKPSNIMIGTFGEVQVLDWGFASPIAAVVSTEAGIDSTGPILGTPAYMSPEQARGDAARVDARSDVFSLGAILCEIITGMPPYLGETPREVYVRASKARLDDARRRIEACPDRELAGIARCCLAEDPVHRPGNAGVVGQRIRAFLAAQTERARRAELATEKQMARAAAERRARHLTVVLSLGTLLVLLVGGVWYYSSELERRERIARVQQSADRLVVRARRRLAAVCAAPLDAGAWRIAMEAVSNASDVVAQPGVGEGLRRELRGIAEELEVRRTVRERDRKMLRALEDIAFRRWEGTQWSALHRLFRNAFADWGIDVDGTPVPEAAAKIRASAIAVRLTGVMDEWGLVLAWPGRPESVEETRRRVFAIAVAADASDARNEIRSALEGDDLDALRARVESSPQPKDVATAQLLARALERLGARQEAVRVYRAAELEHSDDYRFLHDFALCLSRTKDRSWLEVARLLSMCTALRPNSVHAQMALSECYTRAKRPDQAMAVMARARHIGRDSVAFWRRTQVLRYFANDFDGAIAALRECLRIVPGSPEFQSNLAFLWLRRGDRKRAREILAPLAQSAPNSPDAQGVRGILAYEDGELEVAEACFRRAIALDAAHPMNHMNLGNTLSHKHQLEAAFACYARAHALHPREPNILGQLGDMARRLGRFAESERYSRQSHDLFRVRDRGRREAAMHQLQIAQERLRLAPRVEAIRSGSSSAEGPRDAVALASVAADMGHWATAVRLFAIAGDPEIDGINYELRGIAAAAAARVGWPDSDIELPDTRSRSAWRTRARALLRRQLESWIRDTNSGERPPLNNLAGLPLHPFVAPYRDERQRALLPKDEQRAWAEFFREFEATVTRLRQR